MKTYKIMKELKVLSCVKKEKSSNTDSLLWDVRYMIESDLFSNRDKYFKNKTFRPPGLFFSPTKLERGTNLVEIEVEEDVKEVGDHGKLLIVRNIKNVELLDYDSKFDGLDNLISSELFYKNKNIKEFTKEEIKEIEKERCTHGSSPLEDDLLIDENWKKIKKSGLEYDYLSVIASLENFNVKSTRDKIILTRYLSENGIELVKSGDNWMHFENKFHGIRVMFSNFNGNRREYGIRPNLKIEFTGNFFIQRKEGDDDLVARKMIMHFTRKFGALFICSRVDIRQDIYGVYSPFDYFPDFRESGDHHWSLRTEPNVTYYSDGLSKRISGFNVSNNAYSIVSYDRILALTKKLAQGKISQGYYDYYMGTYEKEDNKGIGVQRLELRLKTKSACSVFYKMFMHDTYDKNKVLKYTMANFGRTHTLRDIGIESRPSRYKENQKFRELFCLKEKENFKFFKTKLEKKTGIKFSEMDFGNKKDHTERNAKMLAKAFCKTHSKSVIDLTIKELDNVFYMNSFKNKLEDFKNIKDNRVENYKKTLAFFNLTESEMNDAKEAINSGKNIGMSYG